MGDAFGNDKPLLRLQINRAIFEIDDKVPLQDKEELIVVVMFVPMILALQSVWLYHVSVQAFTRDGTSTKRRAGNLMSK